MVGERPSNSFSHRRRTGILEVIHGTPAAAAKSAVLKSCNITPKTLDSLMRSRWIIQCALLFLIILGMTALGIMHHGDGEQEEPTFRIETFRTSDGGLIEGAFYSGHHDRVVLLCHGRVFNKESWDAFARSLQKVGIDAFAIDFRGYGNSTGPDPNALDRDVAGAIDHLIAKGYQRIGVIGASMGGQAMLTALANESPPEVDRVVVLAAVGPGLRSEKIDKLFIVARRDPVHARVLETFAESVSPKHVEIFNGDAHAQHLFKSGKRRSFNETLLRFFKD
jgi:dienelactone hydrolase